MTLGSLFSGFGGMDLGLERAGWEIKWQCENDDDASRLLKYYWPGVPNLGDITAVDWRGVEPVDLIAGGDPCQENTKGRPGMVAPKQASLGGEFLRCIDTLRPTLVLRENPPSRLDAPWSWQRFLGGLECLGYVGFPFGLRACCVGADHKRQRAFVFAALPDAVRERLARSCLKGKLRKEAQESVAQILAVDGLAQARTWSEESAEALCRGDDGIPARIHRSVVRGLGNAVCPPVAEWIGRRLMAAIGPRPPESAEDGRLIP